MLRVDRMRFNRNFFGSQAGSPEAHGLLLTITIVIFAATYELERTAVQATLADWFALSFPVYAIPDNAGIGGLS